MFHNSIALISSNIIDMIVCVSVCSDIGNYHWETNMFKQLREQSPRCPPTSRGESTSWSSFRSWGTSEREEWLEWWEKRLKVRNKIILSIGVIAKFLSFLHEAGLWRVLSRRMIFSDSLQGLFWQMSKSRLLLLLHSSQDIIMTLT